jgi:signal transduction histidine kinase
MTGTYSPVGKIKKRKKKKIGSALTTDSKDLETRVKKNTILLVEDDESHAELILRAFHGFRHAWDIHHVLDLNDALKWLEEHKMPFLVISNYLLPDGTGLDLTKGAMTTEEASFPLIIITGVGSEQLAVHALKSGALDYIVKNSEELRELPWRAERAIREWKNITRRKRLEEELEIYGRELERVTHDLEEFTLLMESCTDKLGELEQEYLVGLEDVTGKMTTLTEDLLMLSRVGRKFIEFEQVDLNELLEEIHNDLSVLIEERGGDIIAGKLPTISTQRVWLKELLINLIDNGLKFNIEGKPRIVISCEDHEKEYLIKVNHNDGGSKEKDLSRIFTSSERLYPHDYKGTSLRLTMCKKIMDKFGGKIWVESDPKDGTTFCFTLPKKAQINLMPS